MWLMCRLSLDGGLVVSGGADGILMFWGRRKGCLRRLV